MAPDDTRNIFYNSAGSKVEELPSLVLPVVFPHHLLMVAVASTASTLSTVKSCTQEGMDASMDKPLNCQQIKTSSSSYSDTKTIQDIEDESEIRLIIEMSCTVEVDENSSHTKLSLLLRFEDQMNRQLNCSVSENETGIDLANELVEYGLISELDKDKVAEKINENLEELT